MERETEAAETGAVPLGSLENEAKKLGLGTVAERMQPAAATRVEVASGFVLVTEVVDDGLAEQRLNRELAFYLILWHLSGYLCC